MRGTRGHPIWFAAVLSLGLAVPAAEAVAQENRVEQWTCGAPGCGSFFALDDPACNRLRLTADVASGTGTTRFDGLPAQSTDFRVDGFSRTWTWTVGGRAYRFEIDPYHGGSYLPRGPLGPAHRFSCRRPS